MKHLFTFLIFCFILIKNQIGYSYLSNNQKNLTIQTNTTKVTYHVEIANTPHLRAKGLMGKNNIPDDQGMLFIFEKPQIISMWMKNTYIPLDMLFLDKNGKIIWIHENAKPLDESIISSRFPTSFVIELNAGQVKEKNIQITNQVIGL